MSGDARVRRRVTVHGRVQGVFFRDATRERAGRLDVAGWVANRRDGAVEAVFEGPPDAVEQMLAFVRSGPLRANVEDVEIDSEPPEDIAGFEVR